MAVPSPKKRWKGRTTNESMNVNAVRTSITPTTLYFYDPYDRYGIYVLAEANVECHGEMRLSHEPQWEKHSPSATRTSVKRFRNHASIVMWSMGNESGKRNNFSTAEKAIKRLILPAPPTTRETVPSAT